jgi:hypothetical protein
VELKTKKKPEKQRIMKHEVLGRTIAYFPLIRHGHYRKKWDGDAQTAR